MTETLNIVLRTVVRCDMCGRSETLDLGFVKTEKVLSLRGWTKTASLICPLNLCPECSAGTSRDAGKKDTGVPE